MATPLQAAEPELVLHLPFDGTVDPAVGKELGAPKAMGAPTFVEGKRGQAIALTDGAYLVVKLPDAIREGEFTLTFWLKPLWYANDNLSHPILELPATPGKEDPIGWAAGQFLMSKGWSETIAPNNVYGVVDADIAKRHLRPDVWTHVALVNSRAGKFMATYFDGEGFRAPRKELGSLDAHENSMWVGARANGREFGDIVVDDLRIYSRPVTVEELPGIAGEEFPPPVDSLSLGLSCDPAKAVETPHVKWANPLAGGKVRALCIVEGLRAREIVELAQRLEMEPVIVVSPAIQAVTLANPEILLAIGRKVEDALAAGNINSVLVAGFGWNLLPESTRQAVLAHVHAGGGLLFATPACLATDPGHGIFRNMGDGLWVGWEETAVGKEIEQLVSRLGRDDEEFLTQALPWRDLPLFDPVLKRRPPESLFRGGSVGKGRILIYDLSPSRRGTVLTPDGRHDPFDYDYAMGAAARALLWAAGRDSAVRVRRVVYQNALRQAPAMPVPDAAKGQQWAVELWNGTEKPVSAQIRVTVRARDFDTPFEAVRSCGLKPGLNRVTVPDATPRFGKFFGDVRLLVGGQVADWATCAAEADRGNPFYEHLAADRDAYGPGQAPKITARVVLTKYAVKAGEKGELRWRLYDSYDRLLSTGVHAFGFDTHDQFAVEESWHLPPLDDSCLRYSLVVDLARGGGQASDRRTIVLRRVRPAVDDYCFTSWGGVNDTLASLGTRVMRDRYGLDCAGIGAHWSPYTDPRFTWSLDAVARLNLRPWIYATHIGTYAPPGQVRAPDGADPVYLRRLREFMAGMAEVVEPFSPLYYSLGDETRMGPPDARASGSEQEAFRLHVMARYRTVEELNKAWSTAYKEWTDVVVPAPEELRKGGPIAAQVQSFREGLYAGIIGAAWAGVRSVAPHARVGIEGMFGLSLFGMGQDYWKIAGNSSFMGLYDSSIMSASGAMQRSMARSFQKPGDLLGAWWNYEKFDPEYSRYGPWHLLLRGAQTFMWFTTFCGDQYTALNPDFTPFDPFQWSNEELQPLLAGMGKLVLGLPRDDLGVAVLHNQRNLSRDTPFLHSAMMMTTLLDDLGIQHDFVHGDQVVAGELQRRGVKVLLLPSQYAMDGPVADAIRAFVAAGGALVADVVPAESDGIKRYDPMPLSDCFASGATVKGAMPPASAEDVAAWASHVKAYEKGKTLLFGARPVSYARDRLKARGPFLRQAVMEFLASCGVKPAVDVRAADGSFQPLTVVSYRDAGNLYAGMQREYTVPDRSARDFAITVPAKAHAYDVRGGAYLGETSSITQRLEVARGALFAFLTYRAAGMEILGLPKVCSPGTRLTLQCRLRTEGGLPARGVFRVETTAPDGSRMAPLSCKVRWAGGLADVELPIALNDPVGDWSLAVTDVATGVREEQHFKVE